MNRIVTKAEVEEIRREWEERLNDVDSSRVQVFANLIDRAIAIAKDGGAKVSTDYGSMQFTTLKVISDTAREIAKKKNYQ